MALSANGHISLSPVGQLRRSAVVAVRSSWKAVRYCNGELMGMKMMDGKLQSKNKNARRRPCCSMSLTADFASEAKFRGLELQKRDARTVVAVILGGGAGTRLFPLTRRRAKPAVSIPFQFSGAPCRCSQQLLHSLFLHSVLPAR